MPEVKAIAKENKEQVSIFQGLITHSLAQCGAFTMYFQRDFKISMEVIALTFDSLEFGVVL